MEPEAKTLEEVQEKLVEKEEENLKLKDVQNVEDNVSKLDPINVLKAVQALLQIVAEKQKEKSSLIAEETTIHLQFNFKKIPQMKNKKINARVPHSLVTDNTDVCLFVKDVHKDAEDKEDNRDYQPSVRHFREMVESAGVKKVEEIIPVIRLKREFRDHETQRKLCDSYDLFLADDRISKFLPRLLGKQFYKKRKLPINVRLDGARTAVSFKKALNSVHGIIAGQGSSESVRVGHSGLTPQQISENIDAVSKHIVTLVPGGWRNVKSFYITTTATTSIPLFVSTTSANEVNLPPDVDKKRKLIASGDPGLLGDDEEGIDGTLEIFDDGYVKMKTEEEEKQDQGGEEELHKKRSKQTRRGKKQKKRGNPSNKPQDNKSGSRPEENPKAKPKLSDSMPNNSASSKEKLSNAPKIEKIASKKGPLSKKPRLQ